MLRSFVTRVAARLFSAPLLALALAPAKAQAPVSSAGAAPAPQIEWQRSLEDALALAKEQDRPLLVAINMDAESGCERIVREEYRDPAFVEATREFVCVVAHILRHNPRDYDDDGRRIACPRLGEVTCGEHLALEPVLFEKYLSDGERVAPRHALILQDGKKAWDLSLIFDMRELDRAVLASAKAERERRAQRAIPAPSFDAQHASIEELVARRSNRDRLALESRVAAARGETQLAPLVAAIGAHGSAGSLDALRIACTRAGELSEALRSSIVAAGRELGIEDALASAVRDRLRAPGRFGGAYAPSGEENLLPMLADLDGKSAATRTLLLACNALESYGAPAREALSRAIGAAEFARLQPALAAPNMPVAVGRVLDGDDAARAKLYTPVPDPIDPELAELEALPSAEELEQRLTQLETQLKEQPKDAPTMARYAAAALGLARRRIEAKAQGAQFFLEDAEVWLARALALEPAHYAWWLVRARTAYLRERFRDEAEYGQRAWSIAKAAIDARIVEASKEASRESPGGATKPENGASVLHIQRELAQIVEASRWIGDGHARLLAERSGKDLAEELAGISEGARSLSTVLTSPACNAQDWISMGSFLGAIGLWREELAILQAGAERFPADVELRQRLNSALWNGGRIDLAPSKAEWIAARVPDSAEAAWFAGHAWLLAAEDRRRRMDADGAIELYARSQQRFEGVIAAKPEYAENSRQFLALGWHGRGMAHLLADRRGEAAKCLVEAARASRSITSARDGLDRDVLDLVDQCLEWRASGASPVDALALLGQLDDAAPGDPFWAIAIADAELREALRADGRSESFGERELARADGSRVKERVQLPNEEGDRYMKAAIEAAKRVRAFGDTPELRRPLAQCATIWAERALLNGRLDEARRGLELAAPLQGFEAPSASADSAALTALAAKLRAELGEARPVNRPGR